MSRIDERDEPEYGLIAAFKVVVVVLAIGVLAFVAGRSDNYNDPGAEASTKYQMIEPAPDDAPYIGTDGQANGIEKGEQRVLAAAPAGMSKTKVRASESPRPNASPLPASQEPPVATF
jgi:hypothetical protein